MRSILALLSRAARQQVIRCNWARLVAGCLLVLLPCGRAEAASNESRLAALVPSAGTLSPAFNPNTTTYTLAVGLFAPSVSLTPTAMDSGAHIKVQTGAVASGTMSQRYPLVPGVLSVLVVVVRAADGVTGSTYGVQVMRADAALRRAYIKASNRDSNDRFGEYMAISGNTLVVSTASESSNGNGVGANQADNTAQGAGAAYVFVNNGGVWTQQAYIKAPQSTAADMFGCSSAISGNTLVVGAPNAPSNSATGRAFVYVRTGSAWAHQATLQASNSGPGDYFGWRVAISGDTIVVGALWEDSSAQGVNGSQGNGSANSGAAYVFRRAGSAWTQEGYLKASNAQSHDEFGWSVAIWGDTAVVGAAYEDSKAPGVNGLESDNSASNCGAVYVFVRTGGATWTQEAYLKPMYPNAGQCFGMSAAIWRDVIVVGSPGDDSNATGVGWTGANLMASGAGAAYVYRRTGAVWTPEAYLKASNTGAADSFGNSVAIDGDTIAVGAYMEASDATDIGGNQASNAHHFPYGGSGAVYVFAKSANGWSQLAYVKAGNNEPQAWLWFGNEVGVSGDLVVAAQMKEWGAAVGVNGSFSGSAAYGCGESGAAYVYR